MKRPRITDKACINFDASPITVHFFKLAPVARREPGHRRHCPVCQEGVLLMDRDEKGILKAEDCCILCGQRVVYADINRVREEMP